jgi:hypothetical protein
MAENEAALVPLAPIELDEIPDAGGVGMREHETARAQARKLLKRGGITAAITVIYGWTFPLWEHLLPWPFRLILMLLGGFIVAGAGMYALYAVPSGILRLAATSRFNGLPYWSTVRLALEEGDVRRAAETWNEAYAECRQALAEISPDSTLAPKEALSIARTVSGLAETRALIVSRIEALKAMVPPPATKTIDLEMPAGWPMLGDGTDSAGPK